MERKNELPIYETEGISFMVDTDKLELIDKDNPDTRVSYREMEDLGDGYRFEYDKRRRIIPGLFDDMTYVVDSVIPEFVTMNPEGMAKKYGIPLEEMAGKTDFDFMVDQQALDMRINKGMLPIVDIAGHPFYVDIRMDMLRPKDYFGSKGIVFSDIDVYFDEFKRKYQITYNPQTHEFQEIDSRTITRLPDDLMVVEFPHETELDPVGWNREHGYDPRDGLKMHNLRPRFEAESIPLEQTWMREMIDENWDRFFHRHDSPMIRIENFEFRVDVREMQLIRIDDLANTISIQDMTETEGGYCFDFNIKDGTWALPFDSREEIRTVDIPEFVKLDPEGMAFKYGIAPDEIGGKTDFELMVDQNAYKQRIAEGERPTVDIIGNRYQVDLKGDALIPMNVSIEKELKPIKFSRIHALQFYDRIQGGYLNLYDPQSGRFVKLDKRMTSRIPATVFPVRVPYPEELDPVGWNLREGKEASFRLKSTGIKMHDAIERIPWEKTGIPTMISVNQKKAKEQVLKEVVPGKKKRKGRGM